MKYRIEDYHNEDEWIEVPGSLLKYGTREILIEQIAERANDDSGRELFGYDLNNSITVHLKIDRQIYSYEVVAEFTTIYFAKRIT